MKLKEKLSQEIKEAQKSKDSLKLNALRLIKSALDYKAMELQKNDLEETEEIKVLQHIVKQRKESIDSFRKGNREESAKKEEAELKIVESFLPASLSKEDLEKVVVELIAELGTSSIRDMGKVMKGCMEKFKGKVIDGKLLSDIVKSKLKSDTVGESDDKKEKQ